MIKRLMYKLKTKTGMLYAILLLSSVVIGLSYGVFIFVSNSYKATDLLTGNLMYGIEITSTGGEETINATKVTLASGKTSTILLKITSLNNIISKYGVDYKITSGTGEVFYASSTGWLPTGKISKNGEGIYEKTVKLVIKATTDIEVEFSVSGGYTHNTNVDVLTGFTRVANVYDNTLSYTTGKSLSDIISENTDNNIYGGDAINNYIQYPTNSDVTKNIWRIVGNYTSVGGIKILSNVTTNSTVSNIQTNLSTFFNTLEKTSDYVLNTNKFNCTSYNNCEQSSYENIALLSINEYDLNSYMKINQNWYAINNTSVKDISNELISDTNSETNSNLRPVIYLQSDVNVIGSGTASNPYKLTDKGDVIFASATLNGTAIDYFPNSNSPYLFNTVTCTNGTTGRWNDKKGMLELDTINIPTTCNVDFKDGYTVNLTTVNGTSSPSSIMVGKNGKATFTVSASDGYATEAYEYSCTGGATLNLELNKVNVSNVTESQACTLTLKGPLPTFSIQLLADNPTVSERATFGGLFSSDTTGTLFKTTKTENGSAIYYYAGNTTNNWVKFGKYSTNGPVIGFYSDSNRSLAKIYNTIEECTSATSYNIDCGYIWNSGDDIYWRIIRTNEDGSVRLLYAGTNPDSTKGYIGVAKFNESATGTKSIGYMYGTSNFRGSENSSVIKTYIDTWYENNLLNAYDKYISKTAIYCNDRSSKRITGTAVVDYGATTRIVPTYDTTSSPTYKCAGTLDDKFSVSTSSGGNGNLTYPATLMTADEISFAGGSKNEAANKNTYFYTNNASSSVTAQITWWTISPSHYGGNTNDYYMHTILGSAETYQGKISQSLYTKDLAVRPVISLKSCVKYSSGNGTATSPYVVSVDDTCASAEN